MNAPRKKISRSRRKLLLSLSFFFFLALGLYAGTQIVLNLREYAVSGQEYEDLRQMFEPPASPAALINTPDISAPDPEVVSGDEQETAAAQPEPSPTPPPPPSGPPPNPATINPDYVCWLKVDGTSISYPVVQGEDNDKYLHTSFEGRNSKLGAIFMDFRCVADFSAYHTIIFGHNGKNGAMFGSLKQLLNASYLNKHRQITVTLPNGGVDIWRIFTARKSDINDSAFRLNFSGPQSFAAFAESLGAPEGTSRILTLSTCISGSNKDERLLVQATLVSSTPNTSEATEEKAVEQMPEQTMEQVPVQTPEQTAEQAPEQTLAP